MLLIDEPNLNCANCYKLYESDNVAPACKTLRGCHIEDVAADVQINRICERFMRARGLFDMNEIPSILEAEYRNIGLLDDLSLLFDLEKIWAEFRAKKQSDRISNKQRTKWNRII